jgi:hypothetical protein
MVAAHRLTQCFGICSVVLGAVHLNITTDPNSCCCQFDCGEEVHGVFVVAGGYASELFEFAEEPLDGIAMSVNPLAEREASLPIALGKNIGPCLPLLCKRSYRVGIVGLVRQQDRNSARIQGERLHSPLLNPTLTLPSGVVHFPRP